MAAHVLRITSATAGIILCTILPFLPGRYDSLAVPLSLMAQLFGRVGLLLVPIGVLWAASDYLGRSARKRYVLAITTLIVSSIVWSILALGALVESVTLGVGILAAGIFIAVRVIRRLREWSGTAATPGAIPLYLVTIPVAVALTQFALGSPMTEFSRNRAIRNSGPLIADIERYRVANGRYPRSLVSVHRDYKPSVIGIKEYRYEPSGEAYNVLFEQLTFQLGTIEIVIYNPSDQQRMTSHALDVLQLTLEQLALDQTRGHYAVRHSRYAHWKYFWFD